MLRPSGPEIFGDVGRDAWFRGRPYQEHLPPTSHFTSQPPMEEAERDSSAL